MKRYSLSLAAAMLFAGSAVFAQQQTSNIFADEFVSTYTEAGFTRFEVRIGITQIKIEAYSGDEKVEVILDKANGNVLKSETETVGLFDDNSVDDFLRVDYDSNDDEDGDDSDDDSDDSSDDDSDDNSDGSDDSDDDSNDDNGGDSDGSDDSSDDNGNDDNDDDSNDDNGNDDNSGNDDSGDNGDDD